MSRFPLSVVAGTAAAVMAGCTQPPPVPRWVDPVPSGAAPTATAATPAKGGGAGATSPAPAAAAPGVGPVPVSASAGPATPTGSAARDSRFVDAVRGRLPEATVDLRNEEIVEMGGQACASLAAGTPRGAVAADLTAYGLAVADARQLVALARSALCRS